ncbi:AIR synthase related protein [Klebsiella pneumoniae]|uniref:AIR synthase related protein n=1 Tax=Klebsiella pneumoniae TaxID=573 RepID=UPI003C12F7F2
MSATSSRWRASCADAWPNPSPNGDDCALIPDGSGYKLLAIEGFINRFVAEDPWFAGWCGVMVNLSDIAAMGGRPLAVVNALWDEAQPHAAPGYPGDGRGLARLSGADRRRTYQPAQRSVAAGRSGARRNGQSAQQQRGAGRADADGRHQPAGEVAPAGK